MDPGVEESVMVIIFAAPRVEVKELLNVRDQLTLKYGKEFVRQVQDNLGGRNLINDLIPM